jgi:hypothetical protein
LKSKASIRVYWAVFASLALLTLFTRIESLLFVRRAQSTLNGLASLKVGDKRAEVLKKLPNLRVDAESVPTSMTIEERLYRTSEEHRTAEWFLVHARPLYGPAYLLGFRFWQFEPYVVFKGDSVSKYGYWFRTSSPLGEYGTWPTIRVGSVPAGAGDVPFLTNEPIYGKSFVASRVWKWPKYELHVAFTAVAPENQVKKAFNPNLNRMWLQGCRDADALLAEFAAE